MTTRNFFSILSLVTISTFIVSCEKTAIEPAIVKAPSTLPEGNRIRIHFGTSTYMGCMYSFSNCIWIGWGNATDLHQQAPGFLFDNGDEVSADYGNYFPLTADFTAESQTGVPPQVLHSGFYRFQTSPDGRKTISFSDANLQPIAPLVNPNNPQDNLGQLHNLAMQSIYTTKTKAELEAVNYDIKAARKILAAKSVQFLETEADVVINEVEQNQIVSAALEGNYDNHQAWLQTSSLSANDRKVLGDILDIASTLPVNSPEQLSAFVSIMTELENGLVQNTTLDNPKLVFSAVSVAKYSRYYWYWKCLANDESASRPDWWKADVKGLIEGGILQALVDSLVAALTK
ncbi:MAG: hypothetical protein Q7T20_13255 [Saprospiraceae bacterium]|nr:hypothetical protein [Saprospiraceae bacterium]